MFRTEICIEVLIESGIGKTLKYFNDFCKLYESDLPELKSMGTMSEQILQKWKNFVNNMIFDDGHNFQEDFSKFKYIRKVQNKQGRNRGNTGCSTNKSKARTTNVEISANASFVQP